MDDIKPSKTMKLLRESSPLAGGNAAYLEGLYELYLQDPNAVDPQWARYFAALPKTGAGQEVSHAQIRSALRGAGGRPARTAGAAGADGQVQVQKLINAYRINGHQVAQIDPLQLRETGDVPELSLSYYGLSEADLATPFYGNSLVQGRSVALEEIIVALRATYCGSVGSEYMHIPDTEERVWIQERLERVRCRPSYAPEVRRRLLQKLTAAWGLERYLHTKYVGQKRFSLEGAESVIPLVDALIQHGGAAGVKEVVIGMAHRGRLNMLVNILGKTPKELFLEFEGNAHRSEHESGDVKYHMGFSSDMRTPGGPVHVALAFNPSHLEIVGPVVEGSVRARQERRQDTGGSQVVPILLHGDAAFSGQGVVMETFNMSQSRGFSTKGTVHIVINNQIGFTTSNQRDARSTLYCTDVAKMVNAPIFHVNGDDPEAVLFVSQVALDYRMRFGKDVVIDLVCYRRHGHSEADEPMATQPLMYQTIKQKPSVPELYAAYLIERGVIAAGEEQQMGDAYREALEQGHSVVGDLLAEDEISYPYAEDWQPYLKRACSIPGETAISIGTIQALAERLDRLPKGFELHPTVAKVMDNRRKMAAGALPIDWGFGETMAYASLVAEGHGVRLSGQDAGRGTFFHRHAVLFNQKNNKTYIPLRHVDPGQANFLVINSLLSEEAVLAFEYGFATTDPRTLVLWEAQFGDFANNAQVVIDQFISAGEQKWGRLCGLVLLLPHGYEGQGPEHSSARLERYLQLCAEHNIQVCVPSTPAQIFHLLRRQMMLDCRKPLVVMSPKSLLRHRLAISKLEDLSESCFQTVLHEIDDLDPAGVRRVVLCSGKVYYDLLEKRRAGEREDVAIVRVEQLYPFPTTAVKQALAPFEQARDFVWCQEEPMNQGAWYTSQHHFREAIGERGTLRYAGRPASAAPAVGNAALHVEQLHTFLAAALDLEDSGA